MYDEGTEGYRDCNDEADDWDEIKKTLPGGKSPKWCGARFDPEGLLATVPTVRRASHSWSLSAALDRTFSDLTSDRGALAIAGHDDVAWASFWPGADAFHGGGSPAQALGGAVDGARHAGHVHLHLLG